MTTPLAIIGAGTYAITIRELADELGFTTEVLLDDDSEKFGNSIDGLDVQGPITDALKALPKDFAVAVAIGNNSTRLHLLREARSAGLHTPKLISPHAIVSPTAQLSETVYLHAGSHVWSHACIGDGAVLSPHATIAHHTVLAEGTFVSSGARVGASIEVGRESFIGMGAVVSTGVRDIGERTVIGAGAVTIRDTIADGVYAGNPARMLRKR